MVKPSPPTSTAPPAASGGEHPPAALSALFSQSDLEKIARAVNSAESATSGEIVPYVVAASDDYDVATWRGVAVGGVLGALIASIVHEVGAFWGGWFALWLLLPVVGGALVGYLLAMAPPVRRWLVGSSELIRRVESRAELAFMREEVFATVERTGILIFLSLFERRVVILGDTGINARVDRREWDAIVAGIVAGIRAGTPGDALVEGIQRCGELLQRRGVEIRPDDRNELGNALRMEDR